MPNILEHDINDLISEAHKLRPDLTEAQCEKLVADALSGLNDKFKLVLAEVVYGGR